MERIRQQLSKIPAALFSALTVIAIFLLTLLPRPLGDDTPKLFEGADKIVHAIMFGFLTVMMLLDWQRKHDWQKTIWSQATLYATSSSILGAITECLQSYMGLGRSFEWTDIVADSVGAFLFAAIWMVCQKYWLQKNV